MHDDDWLEPAFYERMVAEMEESPALALVWPTAIMFRGEKETTYGRFGHDQVLPAETAFEELLHGNFVFCPATVLRTSVLREVGPFAEYLTADWLMWLRVGLHHCLKFIDAPLFHYRLHEGQLSADRVREAKDVIDMLTFATGLEEFSGRQTEIVTARFEAASRFVMGVKEEPEAHRLVRELSSYFLRHVPDHHGAIRRIELAALAYAVAPPWLRPRKGGRIRHWLRHLVVPRSER
jgi:hypothetical protein